MDLKLTGKRALVTAASRGLGYATALGLAREGTALVICSRDEARIQEAAWKIRAETGATVEALVADVSSAEEAARLVAYTVTTLGGLDIVVHNAGGPPAGDFLSLTDAQWQKAFDQNLMSLVRLVNAAAPELKKAGGGRILTIASSSIKQPIPGLVLSNAFRTGVYGLVKTLARELGPSNILLNVVAPGRIQTERIEELDQATASRRGVDLQQVKEESVASIPLGRLGTPEEFANLLVFLASDAGRYISGQAIIVDGGATAAL
ncbi:MAG: SDR family oxidoreductase [Acidobacteria bacterium]|nr:SDR family oxidoreductase [Acidobacteriota bacterium]